MPFIKSAAPKELVEAIDRIETQADECFRPLKLLERQWNIAAWAVLVASVGYIERTTTELGDNSPLLDATLMNMGMVAPIAINWARKHAKPSSTLASRLFH